MPRAYSHRCAIGNNAFRIACGHRCLRCIGNIVHIAENGANGNTVLSSGIRWQSSIYGVADSNQRTSDHHAADVRRAYLGIIVNQLVAT
ncbi:hypothetical protein AVEN_187114-1 [Araneus ventricosus]|uniref:Uncharacterized protein n=1 Tax=Araneus ventricosus TaxID=182803 RepID=A0A4Y2EUM1_ARAVE|nr:hypothetical protein AVEN_187114-1 [Araneus ventricosus]